MIFGETIGRVWLLFQLFVSSVFSLLEHSAIHFSQIHLRFSPSISLLNSFLADDSACLQNEHVRLGLPGTLKGMISAVIR
jgi:hypothetical protein